jgi:hypothetical protein
MGEGVKRDKYTYAHIAGKNEGKTECKDKQTGVKQREKKYPAIGPYPVPDEFSPQQMICGPHWPTSLL